MTNRGLVGILFVAATIIIILVLYLFYPGVLPHLGPGKPGEALVKSQTTPTPAEKPGEKPGPTTAPAPAPPPSPAPQGQPQPSPSKPAVPPEPSLTKPEAAPPAPQEAALPPLEPKEGYGLLAGSFRKYRGASKRMEKLKKQGQEAFIRREAGKYQVWVGPFATRQEAEAAAKSIKQKSKISPKIEKFVTPVPK